MIEFDDIPSLKVRQSASPFFIGSKKRFRCVDGLPVRQLDEIRCVHSLSEAFFQMMTLSRRVGLKGAQSSRKVIEN